MYMDYHKMMRPAKDFIKAYNIILLFIVCFQLNCEKYQGHSYNERQNHYARFNAMVILSDLKSYYDKYHHYPIISNEIELNNILNTTLSVTPTEMNLRFYNYYLISNENSFTFIGVIRQNNSLLSVIKLKPYKMFIKDNFFDPNKDDINKINEQDINKLIEFIDNKGKWHILAPYN